MPEIETYDELISTEKGLFTQDDLTPSGDINGKYLTVNGKVYMCAFVGMHDVFGGYLLVIFRVNGKLLALHIPREDLADLAGDDYFERSFDENRDILEKLITVDPDEYVNDWGLYRYA